VPGVLLRADPQAYHAAASLFGDEIADRLIVAADDLDHRLSACTAMAGSDPAGVEWAGQYNPVAGQVATAIGDAVNACLNVAALLQASGFNHADSDAADPDALPRFAQYALRSVTLPQPTAVSGGHGDTPSGWSFVADAVGYWPNGHQDRLREASAAWRSAAEAVEAGVALVPDAVRNIEAQISPEVPAAVGVCRTMSEHLGSLAMAMRGIAGACETYAQFLDQAHAAVEHELGELLAWTVGIEGVGAAFAFFTGGFSEAAAQTVEAGRIAATAARIASILGRFSSSVRVAHGLAEVGDGVLRTTVALREVRMRRPVYVPGHPIPGFPVLGEQAALRQLQDNAARGDRAIGSRRVDVGDPARFDPSSLRGLTMQEVMDSIPSDWPREPSASGGGIVFVDPNRYGRQIRVMPGYRAGSRPDPVTCGPYVLVSQNGEKEKVPLYGNPTL
jgi:hypothetical protein